MQNETPVAQLIASDLRNCAERSTRKFSAEREREKKKRRGYHGTEMTARPRGNTGQTVGPSVCHPLGNSGTRREQTWLFGVFTLICGHMLWLHCIGFKAYA